MDEIKIISAKENKDKVEKLSIDELQNYKKELLNMIDYIENEIIKRMHEKNIAEKLFKK